MKSIALKYGFWMFAGFTAFFLLMHLFGLSDNYFMRLFNGVIHLSLIYLAIREYNQRSNLGISNYMRGVAMGMYASFVGVLAFTSFMFFFLIFDAPFMAEIQKNYASIGEYLNPFTISLFLFMEGVAVSLIGSYVLTRVLDANMIRA